MVETFDVGSAGLVLDMTNFATHIDFANDKAPIAQRGHAKQKRVDLRLVGLGLVVSVAGAIPLLSHAYPGDRTDVNQFSTMVAELVKRWGTMAAEVDDLSLVYDVGQDPATNQALRTSNLRATGGSVGSCLGARGGRDRDRLAEPFQPVPGRSDRGHAEMAGNV